MNVVEKAGTEPAPERRGLRPLPAAPLHRKPRRHGELDTRNEPVDLAGIAEVMEGNQKAVLFRAAGPEKAELVGNVMGGRSRIAAAFGVKPNELLKEVQRRLRNKPEMFEVTRAEAPCQEVVLTGDDADVTRLPVHLQHGADGGPYISASIDYVIDPKTGFTNVGLRRLMLRSEHETGIDLVAPSDLQAIYLANAAAGKPTPVSFVVGAHPIDHVAGVMRLPVDELGIVASLRDAPLAGGQMRHQRHPRAGRRRICHRGLSRREGPSRAGRALRRIPRLLRRGQAQSGVPRHRDHASRRRAVPDLDHRRQDAGPHRHRAAFGAAHRGQRSGTRCRRRCASRSRSMPRPRAAARSTSASRSASACRARRATPSAPAWARSPTARTSSWSIPTSTSSPTSRWTGRWRRASSPTAT